MQILRSCIKKKNEYLLFCLPRKRPKRFFAKTELRSLVEDDQNLPRQTPEIIAVGTKNTVNDTLPSRHCVTSRRMENENQDTGDPTPPTSTLTHEGWCTSKFERIGSQGLRRNAEKSENPERRGNLAKSRHISGVSFSAGFARRGKAGSGVRTRFLSDGNWYGATTKHRSLPT